MFERLIAAAKVALGLIGDARGHILTAQKRRIGQADPPHEIADLRNRLDLIESWQLHISNQLNILLSREYARPYYPLGQHLALTKLSTGQPFYVDTEGRDIAPWIILGGSWEHFVDDLLGALVEAGDTFIDVGANLGYYTVKIGGLVGSDGRVFAFEPNPAMFEVLQENVNINGFVGRVFLVNAAAGDAPGRLAFNADPSNPGGGTVQTFEPTSPEEGVPIVRIDDSLPADCQIDLVKIDVEGFEPMVLDGMAGALARSPEAAIITEFNYNGWARFGNPVELLMSYVGDRRLFRIFHDSRLEELAATDLTDWIRGDFVSYFLLLPKTAKRTSQIDRYLAR